VARLDQRETTEVKDQTGLLPDKSVAAGPAVRRFPQGSEIKFSHVIYNAVAEGRPAQLIGQIRVFHDGKMVLTSDPAPINFQGQTDLQHLVSTLRFQIGPNIEPGDYVFQIIVTDSAKQKPRVATQWIDFEVVK